MGKFEEATKKFIDAFNRKDPNAVANLYANESVSYDPMYPEPLRGRSAVKEDAATYFRAFPDVRMEARTIVEKGDDGAAEFRMTGTNTGPLKTPTGEELPATRKRIDLTGAVFIRLNADGLIVEERRYYDTTSFARQLGLVPEPAAAAAR